MPAVDNIVKGQLNKGLLGLEKAFDADVISYNGEIAQQSLKLFRDFLENLTRSQLHKRLAFLLTTNGGSAEASEKIVEMVRHHYEEVYFVVPDVAFSAGTILCMSGDKIYMDYTSSLGPIDPQVHNGKAWVPALGYLDKVEDLLKKAQAGTLSDAEFLILQSQDLATLRAYEQARDLTVTLLKSWLVRFKFRTLTTHRGQGPKLGTPVTPQEKEERAEEIARLLGDNKRWHSHGRMIGVSTLRDVLRLEIDDYSGNLKLRTLIRSYTDSLSDYILRMNFGLFLHSRSFF